jgi:Family of unknown function (DUF695)
MWRFSAAFILFAVTTLAVAAPGFYSAAEEWETSKHEIGGKIAAVRTNTALSAVVTRGEFGRSLRFFVPFNIHNDRPFPERLDREDLEKIEAAIEDRLVDPGHAIFATIITVNNAREFLLYVKNMDQAQALAEKLIDNITSHKISYRLESDPNWEAWSKFSTEVSQGR